MLSAVWIGRTLPLLCIVSVLFLSVDAYQRGWWSLLALQTITIVLNLYVAFVWWFKFDAKGEYRKK